MNWLDKENAHYSRNLQACLLGCRRSEGIGSARNVPLRGRMSISIVAVTVISLFAVPLFISIMSPCILAVSGPVYAAIRPHDAANCSSFFCNQKSLQSHQDVLHIEQWNAEKDLVLHIVAKGFPSVV